MRRRPPRSTLDRSSAASDVYKRQDDGDAVEGRRDRNGYQSPRCGLQAALQRRQDQQDLSLIHISSPRDRTRSRMPSSA